MCLIWRLFAFGRRRPNGEIREDITVNMFIKKIARRNTRVRNTRIRWRVNYCNNYETLVARRWMYLVWIVLAVRRIQLSRKGRGKKNCCRSSIFVRKVPLFKFQRPPRCKKKKPCETLVGSSHALHSQSHNIIFYRTKYLADMTCTI
jgi:hypothetical protein